MNEKNLYTRILQKGEALPYPLLLLADETIDAIERYIHKSEIYVLEVNESVSAVYVLHNSNEQIVEIKNIAVAEQFQGQGIGTFLLKDAISKAKIKGFSTIVLGTGDASKKQISLYRKVGFKIFNRKVNFFLENYPLPIYENGIQLKDMIMLKQELI